LLAEPLAQQKREDMIATPATQLGQEFFRWVSVTKSTTETSKLCLQTKTPWNLNSKGLAPIGDKQQSPE
jgi:hypothetical protein